MVLLLAVPIGAAMNTLCNIIITCTIFGYLWRSEVCRTSVICDLVIMFINMGALTWSVFVVICARPCLFMT